MKQTRTIPAILTPAQGMYLTQEDDTIDIKYRIVTQRVILAATDSATNWKEISAEDAALICAERTKWEQRLIELKP